MTRILARPAIFLNKNGVALMRVRLLIFVFLLVSYPLLINEAFARPRAILMIRDFNNWLDFEYEYVGRDSNNKNSDKSYHEHRLTQTYHFDMQYAVYNPRWLHGHIDLGLGMCEEWYDGGESYGSGNGSSMENNYRIDGIMMDRRATPIDFFALSQTDSVDRRFDRDYDLTTDNYGIGIAFKNLVLPGRINYMEARVETDGLNLDRVQKTKNFTAVCSNIIRDFSFTELNFTWTEDDTSYLGNQPSEDDTSTEFSARNNLSWGEHLKRSYLSSAYRYRRESGYNDLRSIDWYESALWKPGTALKLGLDYHYNKDETAGLERRDDRTKVWMEHQLYDSLTTRAWYRNRDSNFSSGKENEYDWLLGAAYKKDLPWEAIFSLGYSYDYGETDRNLDSNIAFVIDEKLMIDTFGRNVLRHLDIIADTIVVQNQDKTITYQEGSDYLVVQDGRETELVIPDGSLINEGEIVLVSYQYLVEPDINYSQTINRAFTSLALFQQRYRFYGDLFDSRQSLIGPKGDPDLADSLYDLTTYTLGFSGTYGEATYGVEYVDFDATTEKRRHVEAFWRYHLYYPRQFFFFALRDRVTKHYQVEDRSNNSGRGNTFTADFRYKRKMPLNALFEAHANILDQRGWQYDRDELNIQLSYQLRVGKLVFEARVEEEMDWYEGNRNSRDDRVYLRVRRYF